MAFRHAARSPPDTHRRPPGRSGARGVGTRGEGRSRFWGAVRALPIGRGLAVAASVITVFALLLGGAVYLSRNALPGDSLYGVKRASEQFELYTDSSDTARAQDHLDFAATRVDEARRLAARPSADGAGRAGRRPVAAHVAADRGGVARRRHRHPRRVPPAR